MVEYVELTGNPRHDKLISLVMSKGYISNEELAKILNVTPTNYTTRYSSIE